MLDISNSRLRSLKEVNIPEDIIELECSNNKLETLEGIEKCVNLTKLYCSYNKLKTLGGIDKCINLTELICKNNGLRKLKYCPESIIYIRYDDNPIKEEYRGRDIDEIHRINKERWERSIYKEVMKEDNFI